MKVLIRVERLLDFYQLHFFRAQKGQEQDESLFEKVFSIQSMKVEALTFQKPTTWHAINMRLPAWYYTCPWHTCLSFLKKSVRAEMPCIASSTTVFASDLEDPGLPTRKRGMRSSVHTTIINTFSFSALLRAIFSSRWTFFRNIFWHLKLHMAMCVRHTNIGAHVHMYMDACTHIWMHTNIPK